MKLTKSEGTLAHDIRVEGVPVYKEIRMVLTMPDMEAWSILTPDEARSLGLLLLREAMRAENPEMLDELQKKLREGAKKYQGFLPPATEGGSPAEK